MDRDTEDLRISEMLKFSKALWEKNKDNWSPMEPKYGKSFILYMIEEIGEVISIKVKMKLWIIMKLEKDLLKRWVMF